MGQYLEAGGVKLPSPTLITVSDELIWTSDTGRTQSGKMAGGVVAEKKTVSVKWSYVTEREMRKIKKNLPKGFFKIKFNDDGEDKTLTVYRGTIKRESLGDLGDGVERYKDVTVDLIER